MFDYTDDEDSLLTTPGVVSQGQEYPTRHSDIVQANAGTGEYNAASYPMAPLGMRGSPDGIGSYSRLYQMPTPSASGGGVLGRMLSGSPILNGFRAVSGLGDAAATTPAVLPGAATAPVVVSGLLVAAVAVGLVLTGVSGYYVGKAVAPNSSKESKYAWWGVVAALAGGPVGLGIEAVVALGNK